MTGHGGVRRATLLSTGFRHGATGKATRIELLNFSTPHMRAFHMSWIAFFLCFFAWFGIAPLMSVVRDRAALTERAGRLVHHRLGGGDDLRAAAGRLAVRSHRAAADVHVAVAAGLAAGDGDRTGARLHDVSDVPRVDRRDRRVVRDYAVSHVADVRRELRRHGQCDGRRLGKSGRRRDAIGHAAAVCDSLSSCWADRSRSVGGWRWWLSACSAR